jgi:hypothetical protein
LEELARAHCARGASAERDVAVHGVQGAIIIVGRVSSVGDAPSAGPGVVSGGSSSLQAHEIVGGAGAVVPGGTSVAVNVGGIADDRACDGHEQIKRTNEEGRMRRGTSLPMMKKTQDMQASKLPLTPAMHTLRITGSTDQKDQRYTAKVDDGKILEEADVLELEPEARWRGKW